MKALQAMTRDIICIHPEDGLEAAHDIMGEWDIRHLPVVDEDGRLVGILSDRDILLHSTQGVRGEWDVEEVDVSEVMTANPTTCTPNDTIAHIATVMTDKKISSLPVVEADGDLVGLITSTDLLELLKERDILDSSRTIPWTYQLKFREGRGREI